MTLPVITRLKFEEDRTKYDHSTVFSFHENIRADLQKKAHASNVCCFLDGNNVFSNASLSPNQEKGIQVGMEVIESAGDRFPPDSSSNSADPLGIGEIGRFSYSHSP